MLLHLCPSTLPPTSPYAVQRELGYLLSQIRIDCILLLLFMHWTFLLLLATRLTVECVATLGASGFTRNSLAHHAVQFRRLRIDKIGISKTVWVTDGGWMNILLLFYLGHRYWLLYEHNFVISRLVLCIIILYYASSYNRQKYKNYNS